MLLQQKLPQVEYVYHTGGDYVSSHAIDKALETAEKQFKIEDFSPHAAYYDAVCELATQFSDKLGHYAIFTWRIVHKL